LMWAITWMHIFCYNQKKLKAELLYDPTVPLLDIYPEKIINPKRYVHPSVHCNTIYYSQDMEAT